MILIGARAGDEIGARSTACVADRGRRTNHGADQRLGAGDLDALVTAEVARPRLVAPDVLHLVKPVLARLGIDLAGREQGHKGLPEPGGDRAHHRGHPDGRASDITKVS
jgi:hypothetical protein